MDVGDKVKQAKEGVARGLVDSQIKGRISQRELARSVGSMPAEEFARGVDGLVEADVLGPPQYDLKMREVEYSINDKLLREEYL